MEINELIPGSKIDIRIVQMAENKDSSVMEQSVYYSTVFDVSDGFIEVNMPTIAGKLQLLKKNIRYEFVFTTEKGLFKADGTVVDYMKKGNFYLLKIELTNKLQKYQRRQYFRLSCILPVMFLGLTEEVAALPTIDEVKESVESSDQMKVRGIGTMLDISGGGTRFVTSNSLKDITLILVQFQIHTQEGTKDISVVGKVLGTEKARNDDKYVHRVQFFFKDNQVKEKLISYIFEEERRLRKKEQGL